jgi:hypothetical protein
MSDVFVGCRLGRIDSQMVRICGLAFYFKANSLSEECIQSRVYLPVVCLRTDLKPPTDLLKSEFAEIRITGFTFLSFCALCIIENFSLMLK